MNLTEPHCGTDLGLMRTKAVACETMDRIQDVGPEDLSSRRASTDMTDNVIHLVLAKIPGGPDGSQR